MKYYVIFVMTLKLVNCANILGVFIIPSISHQVVFQPIWRELSLRGHKVTVITPNPLNDPSLTNLTEIDVNYSYSSYDVSEVINPKVTHAELMKTFLLDIGPAYFDAQMKHPQAQALLKGKEKKFDLVMVEMIYIPSVAFSYKFQCPFVGILSLPSFWITERAVGNPIHPVLRQDFDYLYNKNDNFWNRLNGVYSYLKNIFRYDYEILPEMDKKAREYFGNDMPYLGDIEKNVSLILTTENMIVSQPTWTVPTLIHLGNTHLKKAGTLPTDLKKELDEATQGVIYLSLGSNVKSANLSTSLRETIISAFAELPFKILWKWETDYLPGKPSNVVIRKWLPQEAVLAHPNVKLFITQGGLQSFEEAIYYKIPLVGMPFIGDQKINVQKMVEFGVGLQVNVETVTKSELKSKILEVFNNKKYRENISKMSDMIWDEPMTGLEKAIWWIEYVLRHNGAKHLRSPLLDFPLYQYLMLDIITFLFTVCTCLLAILFVTCKYLVNVVGDSTEKTIKTH